MHRRAWTLVGLGALALSAPANAALPPGRGILLPLQDRVGDPDLARLVDSAFREELSAIADLSDGSELRKVLRRLRVRDASDEFPARLAVVGRALEIDWLFLATLHVADPGPTPQVALSARVMQPGSPLLWWAGFESSSGRDRERWLELGRIESLDELVRMAVRDLVAQASGERPTSNRGRLRQGGGGFLRQSLVPPSSGVKVAVVPLDSVADSKPGASAELVTAALLAVLDERGFTSLLPGRVREIRQIAGASQPGSVTRSQWEELAAEGGAQWIVTGTVETFVEGAGENSDPWVAFSVRLLEATSGRIDWSDGMELTGRETASVFDRSRIFSAGKLTHEMMRALFDGLDSRSDQSRSGGAQ